LPIVIFMMITVGLIVGFMVNLVNQQSATVNLGVLAARADWATRSAAEWATYQVKNNDACPGAAPDINQFTITVSCTRTGYQEASSSGNDNRFRYDLSIRAEASGIAKTSPDYAYRKLDVTLIIEKP